MKENEKKDERNTEKANVNETYSGTNSNEIKSE